MAITDENKIDVIGIEKNSKNLILTVSDHLDWTKTDEHLLLLQNKLNFYLHFTESNQISDYFTENQYNKIVIKIVFKYEPGDKVVDFLRKVKTLIENSDILLDWEVLALKGDTEND
jgi:hypothetical protein